MKDVSLIHKSIILVMPLFGSLASVVSGYFIVYFTMLEEQFKSYHGFTTEENDQYFTYIVAVLPIGAFLGSFIYNRFVNSLGQNQAMKLLDIMAIVAALLQVVTIYYPVVIVSRLIMGFYCAITTGLIPSWILSMSPNKTSGIFGTFNYLAIVFGMAEAYCMGEFLQTSAMSRQLKLALYIGLPIGTSIVHLFGLKFFGFDNIERLIEQRDHSEMVRFMKKMYGKQWRQFDREIRHFKMNPVEIPVIKEENENEEESKIEDNYNGKEEVGFIDNIKKNFTLEIVKKKIKVKICFEDSQSKGLAIMLAVANQTSGIFAVLQYSKQLFNKIEKDNAEADQTLLILGFFQVAIVFMSGFFINKFGRRPMMLIGQGIVLVSLFLCTVLTSVMVDHEIVTTCFIFLYIFGYSISMGPLFMMYAVEALLNVQMIIKIYWGLMIMFTLIADILIEEISVSFMFGIFFVCSTISFFYFRTHMIQTKDVPKKEIKQLMNKNFFVWQNSEILFSQTMKGKGKESSEKSLGTI